MANFIDYAALFTAFATLFVVIDPIGLAPIFVALTQGMAPQKRKAIALQACVIAFVILSLFGLLGNSVLGFAGISMPAFTISGGALLFLTTLEMLFELRGKRRGDKGENSEDDDRDPSVFPLSIPLIAGPGAIASIILLTNETRENTWQIVGVFGAMLVVILTVVALFLMAGMIERVLGKTGISVLSRLFWYALSSTHRTV